MRPRLKTLVIAPMLATALILGMAALIPAAAPWLDEYDGSREQAIVAGVGIASLASGLALRTAARLAERYTKNASADSAATSDSGAA